MKKSSIFLNLSVLALCAGAFAMPAKAQPAPTSIQKTETSVAVVESVDHATRQVLLSDSSGNLETVVAGPQVRNLDRVAAGDHVVLTFSQAIAVQLTPPGQPLPGPAAVAVAVRAAKGELPAGAAYAVVDLHARITTVDKKTNTVSFTRADGSAGTIQVQNPSLRKFAAGLKTGDTVELQYLQAVTITVQKTGT
jgi:hypothetical protein